MANVFVPLIADDAAPAHEKPVPPPTPQLCRNLKKSREIRYRGEIRTGKHRLEAGMVLLATNMTLAWEVKIRVCAQKAIRTQKEKRIK